MDRADEIAAKVTGRPKGSLTRKAVADALREYGKEAEGAEKERCAKVAAAHRGACQTGCETGEEIAAQIREGEK